jgi:hypothetical protein
MSDPAKNRFPFSKIVAVMAVCLLVGVGLCGLDYALGSHGIGKTNEEFNVGPFDSLSLAVMALSAIGLVLSLLAWVVAAIIRSARSEGEEK